MKLFLTLIAAAVASDLDEGSMLQHISRHHQAKNRG